MTFWWWDDALAVANGYAATTGRQYRVRRTLSGKWSVGVAHRSR